MDVLHPLIYLEILMTNNTITDAKTSAPECIPSANTASLFPNQPIIIFPTVNMILAQRLIQSNLLYNLFPFQSLFTSEINKKS